MQADLSRSAVEENVESLISDSRIDVKRQDCF